MQQQQQQYGQLWDQTQQAFQNAGGTPGTQTTTINPAFMHGLSQFFGYNKGKGGAGGSAFLDGALPSWKQNVLAKQHHAMMQSGKQELLGSFDQTLGSIGQTEKDMLGAIAGYGKGATRQIRRSAQEDRSQTLNQGISSGLSNSTVMQSMLSGANERKRDGLLELSDQIAQMRLGTFAQTGGMRANTMSQRSGALSQDRGFQQQLMQMYMSAINSDEDRKAGAKSAQAGMLGSGIGAAAGLAAGVFFPPAAPFAAAAGAAGGGGGFGGGGGGQFMGWGA